MGYFGNTFQAASISHCYILWVLILIFTPVNVNTDETVQRNQNTRMMIQHPAQFSQKTCTTKPNQIAAVSQQKNNVGYFQSTSNHINTISLGVGMQKTRKLFILYPDDLGSADILATLASVQTLWHNCGNLLLLILHLLSKTCLKIIFTNNLNMCMDR